MLDWAPTVPPTILLAEPPDGTRESSSAGSLLASALRLEGFEVMVASSAEEARRALEQAPTALAVIDLMLRTEPTSSGLDLARELKQRHPEVRVLLTSSYHLSERQLERADCGISGFIPKPYDVAEVVRFIVAKVSGPQSGRRLWHAESASGVVPSVDSSAPRLASGERARR